MMALSSLELIGGMCGLAFGGGAVVSARAAATVDWRALIRAWAASLRIEPTLLSWLVLGGAVGGLSLGSLKGVAGVLPGIVFGAAGALFVYRDRISRERKRRSIEQSLVTPAFLDMLAISMATGVGLRSSLSTLVPKSEPLLQDLWRPVTDTAELSLVDQLQQIARTCHHSPTQRIANALIVSTERGTPIVEVLQNLAQEVRAESRRQLLEIAAKKDVHMMLPVVFGILPSITAVALFPAVGSLTSLA